MKNNLDDEEVILSDFLKSIGPWKNIIVIGGGFAPIIYKLYLSNDEKENLPVGTRDIDSIISKKNPKLSDKNIANHLIDAGFKPVFKSLEIPAVEAYVKAVKKQEFEIEFLTPNNFRIDKNKNVDISGIVAQPLNYLEISLENPMKFITKSNYSGFVVSPEKWIFHKGLTFPKRKNENKILKDLYGIWYAASQLGDFSKDSINKILNFKEFYPKWYEKFKKNINNWIDGATLQDWKKLEMQDPYGKLGKENFIYILKKIC
jgi:hypothetical protein